MDILLDMDSTIADWDEVFDEMLDVLGPEADGVPRRHARTVFDLHASLTPTESVLVRRIMDTPGFYAELKPIVGALEAIYEMLDEGHTVTFCSSPWNTNPTCNDDKRDWINKWVGPGWADSLVLTKDKTRIRGDILIDDKPQITGKFTPEWEHVLFTAPYNTNIDRPRITDWADWKEVVNG